MPHVDVETGAPGIMGVLLKYGGTGAALNHLAQELLAEPHPQLSKGERELIAAYVSRLNSCEF